MIKFESTFPLSTFFALLVAPIGTCLYEMLVVHAFRPDNLVSSTQKFVAAVMGENFTHQAEQELDLAYVVEHEVKANTPVLLCSVPGYDASGRVDDLVALTNKPCTSIAIGIHVYILCQMSKGSSPNYRIAFIGIDTNSIVCVKGVIRFNSYSRTGDKNCIRIV